MCIYACLCIFIRTGVGHMCSCVYVCVSVLFCTNSKP